MTPKGVEVQEPLRAGIYCLFKVLRKDGQLFLDATATKSTGEADTEGVNITTTGARQGNYARQKITAPLDEGSVRCKVLVQGPKPEKTNGIGLNGASPQSVSVAAPAQTAATAVAERTDSVRR